MKAEIVRAQVEPHSNADRLDIAIIEGYRAIIAKGSVSSGDLVAYIEEGAVCPDWLLKDLGLEGKLAGGKKNRVKAIKLRGELSQGIIVPLDKNKQLYGVDVAEGDDVTDHLDLVKFEPKIPREMSGNVYNAALKTLKFNIENLKRYPGLFTEDMDIVLTEKMHGTWACFGLHNSVADNNYEGEWIVNSKGISAKGLAFKLDGENDNNLYVKMFNDLKPRLDYIAKIFKRNFRSWYILGEIFGQGVQDMMYGETDPVFVAFDMFFDPLPHDEDVRPSASYTMFRYNYADQLRWLNGMSGIQTVPILYEGKFSQDIVDEHTVGYTTWGETEFHIREGCVVRPAEEMENGKIGRLILKSVNPEYLLRKGGTEFN